MKSDLNKAFYQALYEGRPDPASFEVRSKLTAFLKALDSVRIPRNKSIAVLDVGFGGGELLSALNARYPNARCAGVESAEAAVTTLSQRYPTWDLRVGSAGEIPFAAGAFDVVICSHTLEHLPDDAPAARELKRVLASSGSLIVGVPGPSSGDNPLHERLYTPQMLSHLFGDLKRRYLRCYGSRAFLSVYWKARAAAQSTNMIETNAVQSSKGTGTLVSRIGMRFGIPVLLLIYRLDSLLFRDASNPFEVWGVWQRP